MKIMKMFDTLSDNDKLNMLNGNAVGLFPTMILNTDTFHHILPDLCLGYYTSRSGEKTISPTYSKILNLISSNSVSNSAESILGNMIRSKFLEKWNRVYNVLIATQYNPIDDYEEHTKKDGTNNNTKHFTNDTVHTGINTDTTTYNTKDISKDTISEKEVVTKSERDANSIFGFNSQSPVGDNIGDITGEETRIKSPNENVRDNTNTKTGTDELKHEINSADNKTISGTDNDIYNDNIDVNGRNTSGATLITKELNLRNKFLFFDIVYADIDSIATLQIYI